MKVAEFRDILQDLERVYAAAGAKTPAKDMELLSGALKVADDQDISKALKTASGKSLDDFLLALKDGLTRPVDRYLAALIAAGLQEDAFDVAICELESDRSIKPADLDLIGSTYTNSPKFVKLYKTRKAKIERLRQAFKEKKEFESRGEVIDTLMPWQ